MIFTFTCCLQVLADGSLMINSMTESVESVVCTVENMHGKDSISYSVSVVKPPVAPTIRVSKITTNTITLSWNLPHNGGALVQGNSSNIPHSDKLHSETFIHSK